MKTLSKYLSIVAFVISSSWSTMFANMIVAKLDQVSVTTEGLFINLDGTVLSVDSITVANDGYIIAIPRPMLATCPSCGSDRYVRGGYCSMCGFPDNDYIEEKLRCAHN